MISDDGCRAHIANVGDSRAYLLRNARIRQLTDDHTVAGELVAAGMLTKEEARFYPKRNIITKAIGIRDAVEPDVRSINLRQGDFLTGGDGPVEVRCKALLDRANRKGRRDNIAVVVVFWGEGAEAPTEFH